MPNNIEVGDKVKIDSELTVVGIFTAGELPYATVHVITEQGNTLSIGAKHLRVVEKVDPPIGTVYKSPSGDYIVHVGGGNYYKSWSMEVDHKSTFDYKWYQNQSGNV